MAPRSGWPPAACRPLASIAARCRSRWPGALDDPRWSSGREAGAERRKGRESHRQRREARAVLCQCGRHQRPYQRRAPPPGAAAPPIKKPISQSRRAAISTNQRTCTAKPRPPKIASMSTRAKRATMSILQSFLGQRDAPAFVQLTTPPGRRQSQGDLSHPSQAERQPRRAGRGGPTPGGPTPVFRGSPPGRRRAEYDTGRRIRWHPS
jgi:hypothetical protein